MAPEIISPEVAERRRVALARLSLIIRCHRNDCQDQPPEPLRLERSEHFEAIENVVVRCSSCGDEIRTELYY